LKRLLLTSNSITGRGVDTENGDASSENASGEEDYTLEIAFNFQSTQLFEINLAENQLQKFPGMFWIVSEMGIVRKCEVK
jgi:hypothetical protein